jgi:hypothetical protein
MLWLLIRLRHYSLPTNTIRYEVLLTCMASQTRSTRRARESSEQAEKCHHIIVVEAELRLKPVNATF